MKKRIIAAVMAAVMCFSVTSCTDSSDKKQWQITEEEREQLVELSCKAVQNGETLEITLACDEDLFKDDIAKSSIAVNVYEYQPKEKTEGSETSSDVSPETSTSGEEQPNEPQSSFSEAKEITDYTLTRVDAKTLSITFKNPFEYGAYDFYIHKNGTSSGKFAVGSYYKIPENDSSAQKLVSAEIDGTIYNGAENPVLKVTLENATVKDVKPENIELSGAFEDLSISSVTSNGSEITINTVGDVRICSAPYGYATVSESVLDTGYELMATVDIENPAAYISENTYAYDNGTLKFDVELLGAKAVKSGDELADAITINDMHIDSAAANSDGSVISISFSTNALDLDSAIQSVIGKTLLIKNSALSCSTDIEYTIPDCSAYLDAYIDYLEKIDGIFKGTLVLMPVYGSFDNLTAEDLTFYGNFTDAKVTEIKTEGGSTVVTFTFESDKTLDSDVFEGGVSVKQGKLLNEWGTPSDDLTSYFSYMAETVKDKADLDAQAVAKALRQSLSLAKDSLKDIRDVVLSIEQISGKFAGVLGTVDAAVKILEIIGVFESPEDKIDKVYYAVQGVQKSVDALNHKMTTMMKMLNDMQVTLSIDIDKTAYIAANNGLKSLNDCITELENLASDVAADTRANVVNLIKRLTLDPTDKKSADYRISELSVMYDFDGKVAIPDKINSAYSVENIKIDPEKTITLHFDQFSFPNATKNLKDFSKLLAGLKQDISGILEEHAIPDDEGKIAEDFTNSIITQATYDALTQNESKQSKLNKIIDAYNNFCKELMGKNSVSPLHNKFYTIYADHNFQYEAEQELNDYMSYLTLFTVRYGGFAMLASSYHSGYDSTTETITKNMLDCLDFIDKNSGLHDTPKGYEWCYVVDRPIKMNVIQLKFGKATVNYKDNSFDDFEWGKSVRIKFLNWNSDDNVYVWQKNAKPTDITTPSIYRPRLSVVQLEKIKARYLRTGNSKISFFDYMTSDHLYNGQRGTSFMPAIMNLGFNKDYYVLASFDRVEEFSSETLPASGDYGYEEKYAFQHYQRGVRYDVPNGGVRSAEYFSHCKKAVGSVYNLNTGSSELSQTLLARALYGESHWDWKTDHWIEFYDHFYHMTYNRDFATNYYPEFIEFEMG
ncbi:MAG: hypothetical protein MSH49_06895 [[Eubacterium] saphenum]|nr:hypothetical protein [[Eubacterium] saphenum]